MSKRITRKALKHQKKFLSALARLISSEKKVELIRDLAETQSLIRNHPSLLSEDFNRDSLATTLLRLEECFRLVQTSDE